MRHAKTNIIEPGPSCCDAGCGDIAKLVEHVARQLKRIEARTIADSGLTPSLFYVLLLLWKQDRRPMNKLAEECRCTRAAITGIVDTLERKQLVRRVAHPSDRRSLLAELTPQGVELQSAVPTLEGVYGDCSSILSQEEFQTLGRLLHKFSTALDSSSKQRPEERA